MVQAVKPALWTEDEERRLLALLAYEQSVPSLHEHILSVSPTLPPPPHLAPLLALWERTRHEQVYAIIEMPPRHAKTTTARHGFSWRMTYDPGLHYAYITYGDNLTRKTSRVVRQLVRRSDVGLNPEAQLVEHWETLAGGSFKATTIGGELTGHGIDGVAVIDDPHKNREQAESIRLRDRVWDWFKDTFWSRLEGNASVFVIQTRWHHDDLVGRLLEGFEDPETGKPIKFERLRLPALCDDPDTDPLGREMGQALWEVRFPKSKLAQTRAVMGEYGWWALFMQDPRLRGDALFGEDPGRFRLDDWELDGHRIVISVDPAATESTRADYTAVLVLAAKGWGSEMRVWILDHFHRQLSIPKGVRVLKRFQERYWGVAVACESVGAFHAVPDMLEEEDPTLQVLRIKPLGDKFTRAQPASSAWAGGRILVPIDRPWAKPLLARLKLFTGVGTDAHDDEADALSNGFNTLFAADEPRRPSVVRREDLPYG